jgi:hypothetical protein
MLNRSSLAAALAACCLLAAGCQTAMNCGAGCRPSMAFQKYDCSCDGVCGPCCGGAKCGAPSCGASSCSDTCTGGCDSCDGNQGPLRDALGAICGCTGCGDLYWSEWHNDPPGCEPCDRCGNYTGPGSLGYYRAPYRRDIGVIAEAPIEPLP